MNKPAPLNIASSIRWLFLALLTAYLILQSWKPTIERTLFWGELITVLLFFSCFKTNLYHELQRKIILGVHIWIFFFPVYGILSSYFLWGDMVNPPYLLRHLAFFYYALFFFGGYKWGPEIIQRLSRHWLWLLMLVSILMFKIGGGIGTSIVLGFVWLVCQKGNPAKWLFYLLPLGVIFLYSGTNNGTAKTIALFLFCSPFIVYFMKLWNLTALAPLTKILFRFFLLLAFVFLLAGAHRLMNLIYEIAAAGGTFHVFSEDLRFTDSNGIWRIMLWTYLIDRFLQHPLGVGLGTPMIGTELADFMYLIQKPEDVYISGAHNSFITFLVRLGAPFLIYFIYMGFFSGKLMLNFLHRVNFQVFGMAERRFVLASILTFLIGVIQTCFNVVLESPLTAGIFWFHFGLFVRIAGDFLTTQKQSVAH